MVITLETSGTSPNPQRACAGGCPVCLSVCYHLIAKKTSCSHCFLLCILTYIIQVNEKSFDLKEGI